MNIFNSLVKLEVYLRTHVLTRKGFPVVLFAVCLLPLVLLPFIAFDTVMTIAVVWSLALLLFPILMMVVSFLDFKFRK